MHDIDYDRLAEAIVRAQELASKPVPKRNVVFRSFVMKFMNFIIYAILVCAAIAGIYAVWGLIVPGGYVSVTVGYVITGFLVLVAVFAFLSFIEAMFDKTDDVKAYFGTNISLIALIMSFISLLTRFIDF